MPARVATAAETVACERATIAAGISARELMERAGRAAADEIVRRFRLILPGGSTAFTGPGNNGGDGWVVARCLAESEFPVTVIEAAPVKSPEAQAAEHDAGAPVENLQRVEGAEDEAPHIADASVHVDALLGTGSSGAPRDTVAAAIEILNRAGDEGAVVVSLDVPSGLDATTGGHELCVHADLTLTFGVVKRGLLLARDVCGEIMVLDIGLEPGPELDSLPLLVDHDWVAARIPEIPPNAHKGTRRRLAIVAGGEGMAGAAILAANGALRSGIGLIRLAVAPLNIAAIHIGLPEALVQPWPTDAAALARLNDDADALAIGPGLGRSPDVRDLVERVLLAWRGPIVVDADALSVFEGDAPSLAKLLHGRPAVITPHPAELARLLGCDTTTVVENRFEIGRDFARDSGASVLLKGTPTVIFAPDGQRFVSAAGTAALATGGSGDILTGIIGTLLAQGLEPTSTLESGATESSPSKNIPTAEIGAVAAFIHGRAAELCGPVRGTTLEDILLALPDAWNENVVPNEGAVISCIPAIP
jgi:NAD(P)H-hydrate epimerase